MFLVYDPAEQRKIDLRMGDFESATFKAGKRWESISLKSCFPSWMSNHDYREEYFQTPQYLVDQLEAEFIPYASHYLSMLIGRHVLQASGIALDALTHRNFVDVLARYQALRETYYQRAIDAISDALKKNYGDRAISLQQLSATFRRGDLLAVLD